MPPRDANKSALEDEATSEISEDESDEDSSSDDESEEEFFLNNPALKNARDLNLLAEERWLIEKLKYIRSLRNALKVEALNFQSLKADLYANHAKEFGDNNPCPPSPPLPMTIDEDDEVPIPEQIYPDLIPESDKPCTSKQALTANDILREFQDMVESHQPSNLEDFAILEGECNSKELSLLNVDNNVKETWDIDDGESESDEEDAWSRVNIDMSMLVGNND